ncbi:MAG: hypothetical protein QE487_02545 [Fluviicola sp.]|nr:hypothetical protein [Fluviicola sp.]
MKYSLLSILLLICHLGFSQVSTKKPNSVNLSKLLSELKGYDCVMLYPDNPAAEQTRQAEAMETLFELDFQIIDSLFFIEKKELQIPLFFVMCYKYRSNIAERHLSVLDNPRKIKVCDGRESATELSMSELSKILYENSTRKEKINNKEAFELFQEAQELQYKGPVDFKRIIYCFNKADSLEPHNPIILGERASAKFNSQLDVEGAFIDMKDAILYSLDQKSLEARYNNIGLSYMEICDIASACESWKKAGNYGIEYISQYCDQPFDTVIRDNPDSNLVLSLKLKQPTAKIIATHNSPEMSYCEAEFVIKNLNHPKITIVNDYLDYSLESSESDIYLEAISEDGKKFRFFSNAEYGYFSSNENKILNSGEEYFKEINLTEVHHFPYPGKYKVRIVLRPSDNLKGLKTIYYSNWQELIIVRK